MLWYSLENWEQFATQPKFSKFGSKNKKGPKQSQIEPDRALARSGWMRFDVHQPTICGTLKKKTSIRYYRKKRAPKRTSKQKPLVCAKCTKLASIFRKKQVVIDDESYFGLNNIELAGNAGFYSSNVEAIQKEAKLKRVKKFEPKIDGLGGHLSQGRTKALHRSLRSSNQPRCVHR